MLLAENALEETSTARGVNFRLRVLTIAPLIFGYSPLDLGNVLAAPGPRCLSTHFACHGVAHDVLLLLSR